MICLPNDPCKTAACAQFECTKPCARKTIHHSPKWFGEWLYNGIPDIGKECPIMIYKQGLFSNRRKHNERDE